MVCVDWKSGWRSCGRRVGKDPEAFIPTEQSCTFYFPHSNKSDLPESTSFFLFWLLLLRRWGRHVTLVRSNFSALPSVLPRAPPSPFFSFLYAVSTVPNTLSQSELDDIVNYINSLRAESNQSNHFNFDWPGKTHLVRKVQRHRWHWPSRRNKYFWSFRLCSRSARQTCSFAYLSLRPTTLFRRSDLSTRRLRFLILFLVGFWPGRRCILASVLR